MHEGPVTRRVILSSLGPQHKWGVVKTGFELRDPIATTGLAELYLRYKLACASHPKNRVEETVLRTLVQSNILSP